MKPYKFEPYLKTTLWGGYRIAPFKGIFTAQPNIGESWEISGVAGHESVANINGISIRQGETILVPASENVLSIFGNASFLTATIS